MDGPVIYMMTTPCNIVSDFASNEMEIQGGGLTEKVLVDYQEKRGSVFYNGNSTREKAFYDPERSLV